ncbi:MAG: hypothetical protein HY646_05940 [Acidobacteria bacterium]|nr:hypothetical protein [Acidobacteriota bacterium]
MCPAKKIALVMSLVLLLNCYHSASTFAQRLNPLSDVVSIDGSYPWKICNDDSGLQKITKDPKNPKQLLLQLKLGPSVPKVLVCLALADIPELAHRAPISLVGPFAVWLKADRRLVGTQTFSSGWAVWHKDEKWRFLQVPEKGWRTIDQEKEYRLEIPERAAGDITELGIYIDIGKGDRKFEGELTMSIDRLVLKRSAPEKPLLPAEGPTLIRIDDARLWQPGTSFKGITAIRQNPGGGLTLVCDLDSRDRLKRSGVAVATLAGLANVLTPFDMSNKGVFLEINAPDGFIAKSKFASGVHAGLVDINGNVFWGPWETVNEPDIPVSAALYPETGYPLPLAFRSHEFDPTRVVAVAVRLTVDQAQPLLFSGNVALRNIRIVQQPDKISIEGRRVNDTLKSIAKKEKPIVPTEPPVAIERFIENIGADYPWPQEVYPGIGERSWRLKDEKGKEQRIGGFSSGEVQLRKDFAFFVENCIARSRIWIAGDLRTGFIQRGRSIVRDDFALRDTDTLLRVLSEFKDKGLRIVPVLFDFTLADFTKRERLGLVGEHPEWITDAELRRSLLDALEPILQKLATHPQVDFIDLQNEPEQIKTIPADIYVTFLRHLAQRIKNLNPNMKVTIGSRTSIDAVFWQGLDLGLDLVPSFHWFDKIEVDKLPVDYAPPGLNRNATIVTEVDPTVGISNALTKLWKAGFGGAYFWSLNANDGMDLRPNIGEVCRWIEANKPSSNK